MRKLVESTFVTLDGVISDPGTWGRPYWNDEHNAYAAGLLADADLLLLGRTTYEQFAPAWSGRSGDPYTDKMNAMPKAVASNTLTATTWNAEVISGDIAERVAKLKEQPGGTILKYGTGELTKYLLRHGLLDELHYWVFPTVAGRGTRLLDGLDTTHFRLVRSTPFSTGIVVMTLIPS